MISDRISLIKPINRRKSRRTPSRVQAAISTDLHDEILISRAPEVWNWRYNTLSSREMRGEVSRQLECLELWRTHHFIGFLGVTVWSKRSTVRMERSIVDRFEKVVAVRSRWTVHMRSDEMHYKTPWFVSLGSRSDSRDALLEIKLWPL